MKASETVKLLYHKDTSKAYAVLRELEALSDEEDSLYPLMGDFLAMLRSDQSVIRVRGFRLLCKQARWDSENRINGEMDRVLAALQDEKPTAVRQMLQSLEYVVPYKKELAGKIREAALAVDTTAFKDTMRPLIEKDIKRLIEVIDSNSEV